MSALLPILLLIPTEPTGPSETSGAEASWLNTELPELVALYQHLHRNPELSLQEHETAERIARELEAIGAEVTTGVGGTGVVGVLENGDGPTLLLRTDLDALPIVEETGLPYASTKTVTNEDGETVGVMHACGHDVHMTVFVGAARWLAEHQDRWSGTIVFIGQPAEERGLGARAMLADGLYERFPKPDYALALHVAANAPAGVIAYRAGPALAAVSSVDVLVRGQGGHGAYPQDTVDPIVLGSMLVIDLQTIVSREIAPIDPAVLTVGSFQGGSKHNIIPDEARLQLTLRSYKSEVMDQLIAGIRRRAEKLAEAHGAPEPTVEVSEQIPPTVNDPDLVNRLVPVLKEAIGAERVVETEPVMGGEDFGLYSRDGEIPAFMFWLGAVPQSKYEASLKPNADPLPSLHSPLFAPDAPSAISTGIQAMTASASELLGTMRD